MEYIKRFDGHTATIGFGLEIYKDSKKGDFVARLNTYSPALASERRPGQPTEPMKFNPQEELRDADLDVLVERCEKRIIEIGGKIVTLVPR